MKAGTIKVSVLYPSGEEKTFDMDYYVMKHIPMVQKLLGEGILHVTLEKGMPNMPYLAMTNMYFESLESVKKNFLQHPNREKVQHDIPNFTNTVPVIQISEVII